MALDDPSVFCAVCGSSLKPLHPHEQDDSNYDWELFVDNAAEVSAAIDHGYFFICLLRILNVSAILQKTNYLCFGS